MYSYIIYASLILTLTYASYRDIKYRDIPEIVWMPAGIIAVVINLIEGNYEPVHTLISLFPAGIMLIMSLMNLMGGADFLAVLLISIAHPKFILFPVSLLTVMYSVIIPLGLILYYAILNFGKYREELIKIKCIEGSKKYLYFMGRPMKASAFIASKFTYLLTIPKNDGYLCRATFSTEEEEEDNKEMIKKAIEKGDLVEESTIWVTPALPHILFIFIGYFLAILTPQELLVSILT